VYFYLDLLEIVYLSIPNIFLIPIHRSRLLRSEGDLLTINGLVVGEHIKDIIALGHPILFRITMRLFDPLCEDRNMDRMTERFL